MLTCTYISSENISKTHKIKKNYHIFLLNYLQMFNNMDVISKSSIYCCCHKVTKPYQLLDGKICSVRIIYCYTCFIQSILSKRRNNELTEIIDCCNCLPFMKNNFFVPLIQIGIHNYICISMNKYNISKRSSTDDKNKVNLNIIPRILLEDTAKVKQ